MQTLPLLALASALFSAACGDVQAIGEAPESISADSGPRPHFRKNHCFSHALYSVDGDWFVLLDSGQESFISKHGSISSGGGGRESEPRVRYLMDLKGSSGKFSLFWNEKLVNEFNFDKSFLLSDRVAIISHEDADGTRVELHLFAQPECKPPPNRFSMRSEIEALES